MDEGARVNLRRDLFLATLAAIGIALLLIFVKWG